MRLFPAKRDPVKTLYASAAPANTSGADPRVERCLQRQKLAYTITDYGNFQVSYPLSDGGRTQDAYIASKTMTFESWEYRKVYSTSFKVDGPLSQKKAGLLMADSARHPFGAWCLYREEGGKSAAYFQVAVWADTNSYNLQDAIEMVCGVAADMGQTMSGQAHSEPSHNGHAKSGSRQSPPVKGEIVKLPKRQTLDEAGEPGGGGLLARFFPWMRPGVDRSVRGRLKQAGLKFKITDDGDYEVRRHFTEDGRSQTARISSRTATFKGDLWRQVSSVAFTVDGPLPQEQANALMADSDRHTFGAWCIDTQAGRTAVKFQVAIKADALYFDLKNAIHLVCLVADNMEKETVGWDTN